VITAHAAVSGASPSHSFAFIDVLSSLSRALHPRFDFKPRHGLIEQSIALAQEANSLLNSRCRRSSHSEDEHDDQPEDPQHQHRRHHKCENSAQSALAVAFMKSVQVTGNADHLDKAISTYTDLVADAERMREEKPTPTPVAGYED